MKIRKGNMLFQRLDYRNEETPWDDKVYEEHLEWARRLAAERFFIGGGLKNLTTMEGAPGCLFEAKDKKEADIIINADPLIDIGLYRCELHKWNMFIYTETIFEQ